MESKKDAPRGKKGTGERNKNGKGEENARPIGRDDNFCSSGVANLKTNRL